MEFLRSNTAVIKAVGPFFDKGDGVTIETALTITNERITLIAETDAGSAPTIILDNIAGATSGTANDLNYITGGDNGMMQMEFAAADVNRVGGMKLSITDAANHVPVFHTYFVLPQAIFDWLTGVIVPLPANVTTWLGTAAATPTVAGVPEVDLTHLVGVAQSATDLKDFADDGYDPSTNKVQGVVLADTLTTYTGNTPQTGDSFARLGAPAGASVSADILAVDNLVDDLESRLGVPTNLGSGATTSANLVDVEAFGNLIANTLLVDIAADLVVIEGQTDDIGVAGAGLTAVPWNAAWDAEVQSEVQDAIEVNHLDHLLAVDYDPTAKPGTATALLNELIGSDGGVSQYTANALELAPGGGGTVDANLVSIDGDLTSGNNATLFLKQLNLQNNAGDAFAAHSIGGNGRGMNVSGNGTGQGALYTGGATGAGVRKTGGGTSGAGEVLNGTGASEDLEAVLVAANFATDALTAAKIAVDAAQKIAHVLFRRRMSNVEAASEGDTLHKSSLYGFIQQAQESNTVDNPGALTIYKTDGTTELGQLTLDTDAAADPIVGAS